MDNAVALVQSYLNINGYFTVAEFPVIEAMSSHYRTTTDLDILGFRFAGAGRFVPGAAHDATEAVFETDPELRCSARQPEMLIGEVKEGRAELNPGIWDSRVLEVVLARFGCCTTAQMPDVVHRLLRTGRASTHCGHLIRLVVFGSVACTAEHPRFDVISLRHVVEFLQDHLRRHWDVLRIAQLEDPVFGFLSTLEKAMRGSPA